MLETDIFVTFFFYCARILLNHLESSGKGVAFLRQRQKTGLRAIYCSGDENWFTQCSGR